MSDKLTGEEMPQQPEGLNVPPELKAILADPNISEEKKDKILKAVVSISVRKASFSGPIPPPEYLIGYNNAIPGGAERILAMAEKQSAHRMQLEDYAVRQDFKQSRLGQIFGFVLGILGLGVATALALDGHEAVASILGTTTIVALVSVFVLGKRAQEKDLEKKRGES